MRSLGAKLVLSFGAVAMLTAVLMILIISNTTFNGFDQFIAELSNTQPAQTTQQENNDNNRNGNNGGRNNNRREEGSRRFEPDTPQGDFEDTVYRGLGLGIGAGVLLALGVGLLLAKQLTRPIRALTAATGTLADGDLGTQLPVTSEDEIGELTRSFNQMSHDLAHANQLRQQMTADIAHDLRTPLTVISGYTEGLSEGKFKASPETFRMMHQQVQQLQHLLDDLRTLSLADAGELSLHKRPIDPRALLERTAVAYLQQAEAQAITISVDADTNLPPINVDVQRMVQVLNNLVSNALRYTPANGTITLSSNVQNDHVLLSVRDTGIGIPAKDLPNIFERFYRADSNRTRTDHDASGLGLAITKAIVEAHNGTISVESELGVGTAFTVKI